MGLLHDRIDRLDLGFGIDLMVLEAARVEDVRATQDTLAGETRAVSTAKAELIDRLVNRLGSYAGILQPARQCVKPSQDTRHRVASTLLGLLLCLSGCFNSL